MSTQNSPGFREPQRATIRTIADALGISFSTVSKALNDNPRVREETKKLVRAKAEELHYTPNALAKSLRGNSTRSVCIVMNDTANSVIATLLSELSKQLSARNYLTMYSDPQFDSANERRAIQAILSRQPDYIIYSPSKSDSDNFQLLEDVKQKVVVFGEPDNRFPFDYIHVDYAYGGYLAARRLLSIGHRRIQIITQPTDFPLSAQFVSGIQRAFTEYGLTMDPNSVMFNCESTVAEGYRLMESLWDPASESYRQPFTAVMTFCDIIAHGVYKNLFSHHVRIPEDISVIGFDDNPFNTFSAPPLTTVRLPSMQMAAACVDVLDTKIKDPASAPQIRYTMPTLIDRASVASPSGKY